MNIKKMLPNLVSFSRIPLALFVCKNAIYGDWVAAYVLLLLAVATDALDGLLAMWLHAKTDMGATVDAACDTCLTILTMAGLVFSRTISWTVAFYLLGGMAFLYAVIIPGNYLAQKGRKKGRLFWLCDGSNPFAGMILGITLAAIYMVNAEVKWLQVVSVVAGVILSPFLCYWKRHRIIEWWGKLRKAF